MNNVILTNDEQKALNQFVAKSFMWMIVGLLVSAASAFYLLQTPQLLKIGLTQFGMLGIVIVQAVLAYQLRIDVEKLTNRTMYMVKFIAYALLTGYTFAIVSLVYASASIVQAFITTAGLFGILALYGYTTKRDLTKIGTMMIPALLGSVVVMLLNALFFRSEGMSFVLSIVMIVIFVGLTMYDMQKLKSYYLYFSHQPQTHTSLSIACALELYLDFINLFLSILRIFGKRKD